MPVVLAVLEQGREGNVLYAHGVSGPALDEVPLPLAPGVYSWAVWAFDDEGQPAASSVEYELTVPE